MRESATVIRQGDRLSPDLAAALGGSEAGAYYAVHVERLSAEDTASFLDTRAKVQDGLADMKIGDVLDLADFCDDLERSLGIKARE